ncbi:MAG TPA: tol-pal system protein YbgF [Stellaceae bacterium]|jgi:tol-pal system protein YbgF
MVRSGLFSSLCVVAVLAVLPPARAQSGGDQSVLGTQMRMNALEDQMRQLTGRIEELNNTVSQLKQQLDKQASDTDFRFSQLQGGAAPSPAAGAPAAAPPPRLNPPPGAPAALAPSAAPAGLAAAPPPPTQAAAAGALPSGNAQDQYNYAMGLISQANYPAAEQAMRSFVERFPKDPLAGNAQYWLGATFYARKDYANAATAFAQGYEKYPKSPKAPDDLLNLGMSLTALNQKADACKAFARLTRDFPSPPQAIADRLKTEKQRSGCG